MKSYGNEKLICYKNYTEMMKKFIGNFNYCIDYNFSWNKAVELDPYNVNNWNKKANCLKQLKQYDETIEW